MATPSTRSLPESCDCFAGTNFGKVRAKIPSFSGPPRLMCLLAKMLLDKSKPLLLTAFALAGRTKPSNSAVNNAVKGAIISVAANPLAIGRLTLKELTRGGTVAMLGLLSMLLDPVHKA